MSRPGTSFLIFHKRTLLALIFLSAFSLTIVYAAPRITQYTPGETLDPDCAPGESNCSVEIVTGGTSQWDDVTNGINYAGGRVGIGDTTPTQTLGLAVGSKIGIGDTQVLYLPDQTDFTGTLIVGSGGASLSHTAGQEGQYNTYVGRGAGYFVTTGKANTVIGSNAFASNTTGENNTVFGTTSLSGNITGSYNAVFGARAGGSNDGSGNVFLGYEAGFNETGSNTLYISNSNTVTPLIYGDFSDPAITINGDLTVTGTCTGCGSPIEIINTSSLFSTGLVGTGDGSTVTNAIFLGTNAGYSATTSDGAVILGNNAGYNISRGGNAVIIGANAGYGFAQTGYYNNSGTPVFIGSSAGYGATNAYHSVLLGESAGYNATDAVDSNFIGYASGYGATNASASNFIGNSAGTSATSATYSNFFGNQAGYEATNARDSNFFGNQAGYGATNSSYSNFFGSAAGRTATDATRSNFFGDQAGYNANNASYSNIFGYRAGLRSGTDNIGSNNIIIGTNISLPNATANAINIGGVLFGTGTHSSVGGDPSITSISGGRIGIGVVSPAYTLDVDGSAQVSGDLIIGGTCTGCLPSQTGNNGLFLTTDGTVASWGTLASSAVNVVNSSSLFSTGLAQTGESSVASNAVFLGYSTGYHATNAIGSNFIGSGAGYEASNASYSNLFGTKAGYSFSGNNIGSNNIIIGTNISLPNAAANSINIGGVLFGTGTHSDTVSDDPSITPVSGGRIGIGVVSPSYTLQVGNSGVSGIVARFENSAGTCDINPTSASLSCSSDETLKKDIIAVDDDMLEKILSLQPVTYHWNSEDESSDTHIGFIAQQVEEVFPDLVTTDRQTGLKSLNYTGLIPYTVKAVQELDLKVADINSLPGGEESATFADKLTAWLANASNHITRIFTGEVCLTDSDGSSECLNKVELTQLKALLNQSSSSGPSTPSDPEPAPEDPTDPVVTEPIEETPPEVVPEEAPEAPSEPSEPISEVQS